MARLRMNQAIGAALADAMAEDPTVVVFGEDVAAAGGVFKTSVGLLERFGPERVRDTPISEMAIVGTAVGAAMGGLRPVAEIMFADFFGVALDQVVTQGALVHYLTRGAVTVPMVIRSSVGAGRGFAATHSRTVEEWFLSAPGLKLVEVSGARTAYGLLRAAVREEGPVVVLEPRALYGTREEFEPGDDAVIPLGVAEVRREGADATVVAVGQTVGIASEAIERLDASIELIDLLTLRPWDVETVLASVARTGRLALVEEHPFTGGWGPEVASRVGQELFGELTSPILRITAPDVPVPFTRDLEFRYLPTAEYVAAQLGRWLETDTLPSPWWERIGEEV